MSKHPGIYIREEILPANMSVLEASERLGIGRPALSRVLNGKASLSSELAEKIESLFGESAENLLKMQAEHDAEIAKTAEHKVSAVPYSPVHIEVLEREISAWATNRIDARTRFPVFLRTLVHSTSREIISIDFPGNDSGERHGWDGCIESTNASPWVPAGKSRWEFGCRKDIKKKADEDYDARIKSTSPDERKESTFVFVTPYRWEGKINWIKEKNEENKWKEVRVYDASDLEQWVQQSIPAQVWFAHETGRPTDGVKSLSEIWDDWKADSIPEIPLQLFDRAIANYENQIIDWVTKEENTSLVIIADSVIEGLAFLKVAFDSIASDELKGYSERALVFCHANTLVSLLTVNSRIIPIMSIPAVERSFSRFAGNLKSILIYPKNTPSINPDISLDLLDYESFRLALESTNLSRDEIDDLSKESGRSLTVLRRRMSQLDSVKKPEWARDSNISRAFCCITLAGAWDSKNKTDRELVSILAADDYSKVELNFNRLLHLDDVPVWSVGGIMGVVSKIDALFAICQFFTVDDLERFFECCELVLSEDDPALDFPQEERWMALLRGKTREISGVLRTAIAEMAVLLAVHGNNLFKEKTGMDVSERANRLIRNLLVPLTVRKLESNNHDLQHYAEIAPETFLEILEDDIRRGDESICLEVIKPENTSLFGGIHARTGLLWALEGLAWRSENLTRVVHILATLSRKKLEDNLVNKPINSLLAIFRSWMPQTGADLEQRKASFDYLKSEFPDIAWTVAVDQFDPLSTIGTYNHKPRWRKDGYNFGEPVSYNEREKFVLHCLEHCLSLPQFTKEQLSDLVDRAALLAPKYQAKIWKNIKIWSQSASEVDKSWLRERIRVNAYTHRAAMRAERQDGDLFDPTEITEVFDILRPNNIILEYEWLFRNHWVEMNQATPMNVEQHYEVHKSKVKEQRLKALKQIFNEKGLEGIFQMIDMSGAKDLIGQLMVSILDKSNSIDFLRQTVNRSTLSEFEKGNILRGIMSCLSEAALEEVFDLAVNDCTPEIRAQIFREAPFNPSTWSRIASDDNIELEYWKTVAAEHLWVHMDHVAEATGKLLQYDRPFAALILSGPRMERIPNQLLFEMLDKFSTKREDHKGIDTMTQYYITNAFKRLNEDKGISRNDLVQLEIRYLQVLEGEDYNVPNLENAISSNPLIFVEAVACMSRRSDEGADPEWLQGDEEFIRQRQASMFHFFQKVSAIPGRDKQGKVQSVLLIEWINKVREGCQKLARLNAGEYQIGELLAKSPVGKDGIWPSEPIRDALQATATELMKIGFSIGKWNLRGAVLRGTGGDQEREIEAQYRQWAEALRHSHPVVSGILCDMADKYHNEADYHDIREKVRDRIPY